MTGEVKVKSTHCELYLNLYLLLVYVLFTCICTFHVLQIQSLFKTGSHFMRSLCKNVDNIHQRALTHQQEVKSSKERKYEEVQVQIQTKVRVHIETTLTNTFAYV